MGQFWKQLEKLASLVVGHGVQGGRTGMEAFGQRALGPDDLVPVEQET